MKKKDYLLLFLLFVFIFQPPFLPVSLIYLLGPVLIFWVMEGRKKMKRILRVSHLTKMMRFFLIMTFYVVIVNSLDIILVGADGLLMTRLRSLNQIFFLTISEFAFVAYLLYKYSQHNYSFENALSILIKAAALQGLCAVAAFLIPSIRELFMMFGDRTLYSNPYFMEKRGFGLSMILIDTFGYGMGLMAGYMILYKWKSGFNTFLFIALLLILFSIAVNARTGVLVFFVAIAVKLFYCNNINIFIKKLIPLAVFLFLLITYSQAILEFGAKNDNPTISWVSSSFLSIAQFAQDDTSSGSIEDFAFLSSFISLPSNPFELIFGSGHHVYDTDKTLGFRTDIGYLNMFWELGILGSIVMLLTMFVFMIRPFFISRNVSVRQIALFNVISYFLVQMKAILIGYNPGVFVNYLMTFTLYYYVWKERNAYSDPKKQIVYAAE